ncbi:MAG: hypothetical protein J6S96_01090 [Muribaculaceae bacterium]|nr:hypothetical protein [Muribaculaceae bacterium]
MKYLSRALVAIILMCLIAPAKTNAAVNLETYVNGDGLIPASQARELLTDVLLHNPSVLDKVKVEVANLRKRPDMNIAFVYFGRLESNINTEIYAITLDPQWNVIDGVLLGYDGDAQLLKIPFDNQDLTYIPSSDIKYTLRGDSIIVTRNYEFASTTDGGNNFHKEGAILNRFLIRKDGKIAQLQLDAIANMTEGDNVRPRESRQPKTHSKTAGEFFGLGMNVLNLEQTPCKTKLNPESINNLAREMKNVAKENGRKTGNVQNDCVAEFAQCVTNIGLRDGQDLLSWVARNEGKENISEFVLRCLKQSGMDETEWFTAKLKTLKDKKARKWWKKWFKKEMGIEVK